MRLPSFSRSSSRSRRDSDVTLHEYIFKNDVKNVKSLLRRDDVDVNAYDENGKTPLFIAASFNRYEILDVMLTSGNDVNVNDVDAVGNTALHEASDKGNLDIVHRLIKFEGCDVDANNNVGETPLMKAAYYDYVDIARALIRDGNADLDLADDCGQTALLIALRESSHMTADLLLKCGSDVRVADHLGHSAFYVAVHSPRNRSLDLAKLLLGAGYDIINDANWLLREKKHNIFYQDDEFYSRIIDNVKHSDAKEDRHDVTEHQRHNETRSLLRRTTSADLQLIKAASSNTKTSHDFTSTTSHLPRQTSLPLTSSSTPPPLAKLRSASDASSRVKSFTSEISVPLSVAQTVVKQKKVSFSKDAPPLALTKPKLFSATQAATSCSSILKQDKVPVTSDPVVSESGSRLKRASCIVKAKLTHKLSSDSETECSKSNKKSNVNKHQKMAQNLSDDAAHDTTFTSARPIRYPRLTRSTSGSVDAPISVKVPTRYPHVTHKLSSSSEELLSPPASPKPIGRNIRPSNLALDNSIHSDMARDAPKPSLSCGLLQQLSMDSFEIRSLPNSPRPNRRGGESHGGESCGGESQRLTAYTPTGSPHVNYRRQLSVQGGSVTKDKSEHRLRKTSLPQRPTELFSTAIHVTSEAQRSA